MSGEIGIEEARKILGDLVTAAQQGYDTILTRNHSPVARITRIQEDPVTDTRTDAELTAENLFRRELALQNPPLQVEELLHRDQELASLYLTYVEAANRDQDVAIAANPGNIMTLVVFNRSPETDAAYNAFQTRLRQIAEETAK